MRIKYLISLLFIFLGMPVFCQEAPVNSIDLKFSIDGGKTWVVGFPSLPKPDEFLVKASFSTNEKREVEPGIVNTNIFSRQRDFASASTGQQDWLGGGKTAWFQRLPQYWATFGSCSFVYNLDLRERSEGVTGFGNKWDGSKFIDGPLPVCTEFAPGQYKFTFRFSYRLKETKRPVETDADFIVNIGGEGIKEIKPIEKHPIALDDMTEAELSKEEHLYWGEEPVEELSATRGRIVINGIWRFCPATGSAAELPPQKSWGYIRVPGAYSSKDKTPGIISIGTGLLWKNLELSELARSWYEREITIPEKWKGRAIFLKVDRVSTDAAVYVNDKRAGNIEWPFGEVDITSLVTPGEKAKLDILVIAVNDQKESKSFLDADHVITRKSELRSRGITGDVMLESRPEHSRIDGIFIKTSVREKKLGIEIDIDNIDRNTVAEVIANVTETNGKPVKTFRGKIDLTRSTYQTAALSWDWADPKLWDFKQPNLYMLNISVKADGVIDDEYSERFGFREFRIVGRDFLFNETPFRIRPVLCFIERGFGIGGLRLAIENNIDGYIQNNFNLQELWPWNHHERGAYHFREMWADVADEKGWLLMYPAASMEEFMKTWDQPGEKQAWTTRMIREWKRIRNHPSIVINVCTANRFPHADDQNPLRIGNREKLMGDTNWMQRAKSGMEAMEIIRKYDPTRPITSHSSGGVGDIQTCNQYLNFTPLQEREEWMSEWAKNGDKPFMAIEFGTPFSYNYFRGRNGAELAPLSEPLTTEFCAIYLGANSYALERDKYRKEIADRFINNQDYKRWQGLYNYRFAPSAMGLQDIFIQNTWRSWRTYGISGGMIAWENATGWIPKEGESKLPPFKPGQRGWYMNKQGNSILYGFSDKGSNITEAGKSLRKNQAPLLLWIAGSKENFTEKDHHFYGGETVRKQIVLINDERTDLPYEIKWEVEIGGKAVFNGNLKGKANCGTNYFLPVEFCAPLVNVKTSGKISATADINGSTLKDQFTFTIYPPAENAGENTILVFDPDGKTIMHLKALGWNVKNWDGNPAGNNILVIGQDSLKNQSVGSLEKFLFDGGRIIILGQDPKWLRDIAGFRVSRHVSRRFFPVVTQTNHPIIAGLDNEDFRDWRGSGTLVPENSGTEISMDKSKLEYGYHWGNRGSVSSAAIEKPHNSGWTPILEGEFDLAYSPLMEINIGKGKLIICTLDIAGRTIREPVAEIVTQRLLLYAATTTTTPTPDNKTIYIGAQSGETLLKDTGVMFAKVESIPADASLAIIGEDSKLSDKDIVDYLEKGGKALLIERATAKERLGFIIEKKRTGGSIKVPDWPECKGLSAGDLRLRTDIEANVLTNGKSIAANGMLGRFTAGTGSAIIMPLLCDELDKDKKTYLRFSSWHLRRTMSQVIANMGGKFASDNKVINWNKEISGFKPINLSGQWKLIIETTFPPVATPQQAPQDPGNLGFGKGYAEPKHDTADWMDVEMPKMIEVVDKQFENFDGIFWIRREMNIPQNWKGKDLSLTLGAVDDCDATYFNGKLVGEVTEKTPSCWQVFRTYKIPAELVKAGEVNVLAIRIFDHFGSGGLTIIPEAFQLTIPKDNSLNYYDSDYRSDHALGDDPYRYHRW